MKTLARRPEDALARREVAVRALARLVAISAPGEETSDLGKYTGRGVDPATLLLALAVVEARDAAGREERERQRLDRRNAARARRVVASRRGEEVR